MLSQQLVPSLQDFIQNFGTWLIIAILRVNHQLRRLAGKSYIITNLIFIVAKFYDNIVQPISHATFPLIHFQIYFWKAWYTERYIAM